MVAHRIRFALKIAVVSVCVCVRQLAVTRDRRQRLRLVICKQHEIGISKNVALTMNHISECE